MKYLFSTYLLFIVFVSDGLMFVWYLFDKKKLRVFFINNIV